MVQRGVRSALLRTGQRLTPQRVAIAGALARSPKQASVRELYDRVRSRNPSIGRATVFRALDLLVSSGLAQRLERPGHVSAYVWCEPGHHHHLICRRCRMVEELEERAVRPVVDTIARERGFRVDHASLDFHGLCRPCLTAAADPQETAPGQAGGPNRKDATNASN